MSVPRRCAASWRNSKLAASSSRHIRRPERSRPTSVYDFSSIACCRCNRSRAAACRCCAMASIRTWRRARLVELASGLLAEISRMAGVVTLPRTEQVCLRQVEFLPLTANRVLVILVINERDVQNRVIHTDRQFSETELVQSANYINREFAGESLLNIRAALIAGMHRDKAVGRSDDAVDARHGGQSVRRRGGATRRRRKGYVVAGETNLLGAPNDSEAMRRLLDAFSRKRDILHLLDRCLDSDGIQLFIGDESGYDVLGDYSVVTAPYRVNGRVAGVLGCDRTDADGVPAGHPDRRRDRAGTRRRARSQLNASQRAFRWDVEPVPGTWNIGSRPHYRKSRQPEIQVPCPQATQRTPRRCRLI